MWKVALGNLCGEILCEIFAWFCSPCKTYGRGVKGSTPEEQIGRKSNSQECWEFLNP
jgi:hypothetical protein